jgi:NitT/TauT family transport system substrate-binding protein
MLRRTFVRATAALAPSFIAASAPASPQPEELTPIHFGTTMSDDLRPFLYAQSTGMFKQAGLNVILQLGNSGAVIAQAVVAGALDIGKGTINALILAHAHGIPVVLIAPGMIYRKDAPTSGVVVAPNSPVHSARDLAGKVVACSALGGIAYLGLRALVDAQGADSSTVRWLELPGSAVSEAIQQGRVDAGVTEEPYLTEDIRAGKVRLLLDMLDGYPRPVLEAVYFASRAYAASHHDTIARFAKVIAEAARYSNAHEAETVPLFVNASGMDPRLANQMHHTYSALTFDPAQIQPIIDVAAKYKVIPAAFDAREMLAP